MPRPFEFHWGRGQIVEEASYSGKYTEPAIQLLEYEGHPRPARLRGRAEAVAMPANAQEAAQGVVWCDAVTARLGGKVSEDIVVPGLG